MWYGVKQGMHKETLHFWQSMPLFLSIFLAAHCRYLHLFFLHWEVVVPATLKCPIPESCQCEIWTSVQKTTMPGIEITQQSRKG